MRVKREDNFIYLLVALLLFLAASPVVEAVGSVLGNRLNTLLFAVTLLVAVFSMHSDKRILYTGVALVAVALLSGVLAVSTQSPAWDSLAFAAFFFYLLLAIVTAVHEVVETHAASINRVLGAICIFLLLGIIFSMLYALLHQFDPDAFRGVPEEIELLDSTTWIYYSFVTLTTLGYGDIVPLTSPARTLAYLEAIIGQFYIAILVAGLVGAYLADRRHP